MTGKQAAAIGAFGGVFGACVGSVVGYFHAPVGRPWTGIGIGAGVGFGLGALALAGGVAASDAVVSDHVVQSRPKWLSK